MDLDDLHFLLTASGAQLLRELAGTPITSQNHLQIASSLRQQVNPSLAQAVLETAVLRQRAMVKFERAQQMFFTRAALEQASAEIVATYRAQRFVAANLDHIADLGCGIGGDALALAAQAEVIGVDWDPLRLAMAQENVAVYGHGERFHPLQADLLALSSLPVKASFFDPARRDERGNRFYSLEAYQPPWSMIKRWQAQQPHTAVKIGPGVDYRELPEQAEVEFISVKGELREGVLWFGELHSGVARRATLLPGSATLTTAQMPAAPIAITPPKSYLYEPDKAVIRAHLVEALAGQLGATKIDDEIAYLTADDAHETPFARCFAVEAVFPFQLKRLRRYLRERQVGQVVIKKRGSPLEPESLRQQLNLRGHQERIVFLTHVLGEPSVIIGQTAAETIRAISSAEVDSG